MNVNALQMKWSVGEPKECTVTADRVEIITAPHTDLWQRTYYHFRNDNAPVLQMTSSEKFFSFTVKVDFESKVRFDQAGVVLYLDSDNWIKASVEYENDEFQRLGSVVTNHGFSDWASFDVDPSYKTAWFRLSRREDDFCLENSFDGETFKQMRICHLFETPDEVPFGIFACSPEESSFKAVFTELELTECKWLAHDGQAPDEEE